MKHTSLIFLISILLFEPFKGLSSDEPRDWSNKCIQDAAMYADSVAVALQKGDFTRASESLSTWEQSCGLTEPVFRAQLLLDAISGYNQMEMSELDGLLERAISFDVRYDLIENAGEQERIEYFELYPDYFGYVPINGAFDRQTQRLALQLQRAGIKDEIVAAFVAFYAGETDWFFQNLKQGGLIYSRLSEEYFARVLYFQQKPELSVGIASGLWFPMGNLDVIGMKPSFLVNAGITKKSSSIHAVIAIRFGNTLKPVSFSVQDTMVTTRNQQSGYGGLEWVQGLHSWGKMRIGFTVTGGYDIIDIVEDKQDPRRKTFGSWFLQPGIFWEFTLPNQSALGLYPYFSVLNHHNSSSKEFNGNAWYLTLRYRLSGNVRKTENLKRLGY